MLIAQVPVGRAVLLPQRPVQGAMLGFRHRILVGRLVLGFEGIVGRVMLLIEILVHARMWALVLIRVIMSKHCRRKSKKPGHGDRKQRRLQ